jgi:hypothetical protein
MHGNDQDANPEDDNQDLLTMQFCAEIVAMAAAAAAAAAEARAAATPFAAAWPQ